MYCNRCGSPVPEGVQYCGSCGAPVVTGAPGAGYGQGYRPGPAPMETRVGNTILRGPDGVYRWTYEKSLFRDPSMFFLIWRVFFFVCLGIFAVMVVVDAIEWSDYFPDRFLESLKIFGFIVLGMTALVGISYLIYAAVMGGKYVVDFEMDDRGILHRQVSSQARKAEKLGMATMMMGAAARNLTAVGVGMNAQRSEMYSEFAGVRSVKAVPRRNLIKVNGALKRNQVYAAGADFDFVKSFIASHCPNAKLK